PRDRERGRSGAADSFAGSPSLDLLGLASLGPRPTPVEHGECERVAQALRGEGAERARERREFRVALRREERLRGALEPRSDALAARDLARVGLGGADELAEEERPRPLPRRTRHERAEQLGIAVPPRVAPRDGARVERLVLALL